MKQYTTCENCAALYSKGCCLGYATKTNNSKHPMQLTQQVPQTPCPKPRTIQDMTKINKKGE